MANEEHLKLLKQGVKKWNRWRKDNPEIQPNLCGSNLYDSVIDGIRINLTGIDLCDSDVSFCEMSQKAADWGGVSLHNANLSRANFCRANLVRADLSEAVLCEAILRDVDLGMVNLGGADLRGADLRGALLGGADLKEVDLRGALLDRAIFRENDLRGTDLRGSSLNGVDLRGVNLTGLDLSGISLSGANLLYVQALGTDFTGATFTGACIEDWNINRATRLDGAICEYVYLKAGLQERRPREGNFKPGEFATLFQQALDTVDLIFKDGIDWQAFFQSFQDLHSQYADQDLSIQAIEKKRGGAFIVRVEVAEGADKAAIESSAKELYETKLVLMEQRYRAELKAKDGEIVAYREQSANLMKITELLGSKIMPSEINQTFNAPVGNAAVNNHGTMSAIQNNYGPNTEDITRLLTALRDQAQTFPTDQKDDANDALDLLERDLAEEQPDQGRIGRRLKKLVALGATIGTIASGAAAVSGDVSMFTGNVIELTEKLGIPIEQLPPSNQP